MVVNSSITRAILIAFATTHVLSQNISDDHSATPNALAQSDESQDPAFSQENSSELSQENSSGLAIDHNIEQIPLNEPEPSDHMIAQISPPEHSNQIEEDSLSAEPEAVPDVLKLRGQLAPDTPLVVAEEQLSLRPRAFEDPTVGNSNVAESIIGAEVDAPLEGASDLASAPEPPKAVITPGELLASQELNGGSVHSPKCSGEGPADDDQSLRGASSACSAKVGEVHGASSAKADDCSNLGLDLNGAAADKLAECQKAAESDGAETASLDQHLAGAAASEECTINSQSNNGTVEGTQQMRGAAVEAGATGVIECSKSIPAATPPESHQLEGAADEPIGTPGDTEVASEVAAEMPEVDPIESAAPQVATEGELEGEMVEEPALKTAVVEDAALASEEAPTEEAVREEKVMGESLPESRLDELIVDWLAKTKLGDPAEATVESAEPLVAPTKTPMVRLVNDDELALAAASVRQSWQVLNSSKIGELISDDSAQDFAKRVAMIASVMADLIGSLDFVMHTETPLIYIRGQTMSQTTTTTAAVAAPRSISSLLSGSALGLPFGLANRASFLKPSSAPNAVGGFAQNSFSGYSSGGASDDANSQRANVPPVFGQSNIQTSSPVRPASPFSAFWPNTAAPKLQMSPWAASQAVTPTPYTPPRSSLLGKTGWNLYNSFSPRKLGEEPSLANAPNERFGNFLHNELPKEIKRKIWDDFISDSRKAKSVEEQNALLRKLERGQDEIRTRAPPRMLIETELANARPTITVTQKIAACSTQLRNLIKAGDFNLVMIEGARLFLATLEPESQVRLMKLLVENGEKHDDGFIAYKKTHEVDSDLQIGLLLLSRLQNVFIKTDEV